MDETKIFQFNILNQLRIKATSVTCGNCNDWLNGEVYTHSDRKIYCTACSPDKEARQRHEDKEDFLKDMLFPCKYKECHFLLRRDGIIDHYTKCMYAPIECGLCKDNITNQFEFTEHFETEHQDITTSITLSEPVLMVSLDLEEVNTCKIYISTFNQRTFIILIHRNESKVIVEVAKPHHDNNIQEDNEFTVLYTCKQRKHSFSKCFLDYSKLWISVNTDDVDFHVKPDEPINLQVKLFNAANVMNVPECPICLHDLKMEVYQCSNGHNVCIDCGQKIVNCAICQSASKAIVKLNHLFSNMSVRCPNFEDGCFTVMKGDDINAHVGCCSYRNVKCAESSCTIEFRKCNVNFHYNKKKHNFTVSFRLLRSKYDGACCNIIFKNNMFTFYKNITGSGDNKTILFYVVLMHCEDISKAEKFKFEVHIVGEDKNDPIAQLILSGLCTIERNTNHRISICYKTCAKYFYKDNEDKEPKMSYRCIIKDQ